MDKKRVTFVYTDVIRRYEKAYSTAQVAEILERHQMRINQYVNQGVIPPPFKGRGIEAGLKETSWYLWSKKDILRLHDYLMTQHRGRPRSDGEITVMHGTPSRLEVIARMENTTTYYVQNSDGEFVKVWKEPQW